MASRQMEFQICAFEYQEALKLFIGLKDVGVEPRDYLAAIADQKRRDRLTAALQIAVKCHRDGEDPLRVRKIVCWRDENGKPGPIEAQLATT